MDLQSIISDQIKGAVLDKIAQKSGVDSNTAGSIAQEAIPAILGGLQKNSNISGGSESLSKTLDKNHDGSILDDVLGSLNNDSTTSDGSKILNHVFGKKTGTVADQISGATGSNSGAVTSVLSMLAPIIMGQLGKTKQQEGLDASGLGGLLNGQKLSDKSGILGTLNNLLDKDHDGSALDEIIDMGKNLFK